MKHILFTLALASIAGIANAQHNGHSYTVEGLINDSTLNGQTLYISRYDDGMKVDSTQVTNGQFKFTGKADIPYFCRIDAGREYANFILEGGNIQVNVLTHNDPKGTPMNEEYTHISDKTSELVTELRKRHAAIEQQTEDKSEQLQLKRICRYLLASDLYPTIQRHVYEEPGQCTRRVCHQRACHVRFARRDGHHICGFRPLVEVTERISPHRKAVSRHESDGSRTKVYRLQR